MKLLIESVMVGLRHCCFDQSSLMTLITHVTMTNYYSCCYYCKTILNLSLYCITSGSETLLQWAATTVVLCVQSQSILFWCLTYSREKDFERCRNHTGYGFTFSLISYWYIWKHTVAPKSICTLLDTKRHQIHPFS